MRHKVDQGVVVGASGKYLRRPQPPDVASHFDAAAGLSAAPCYRPSGVEQEFERRGLQERVTNHGPYKGPAPATQDVIGGQVECGFLAGPTVLPMVKAGKLVALAVSGKQRSELLPDVPTVAQAGYPDYDATFSLVLFAPAATPKPIVDQIRRSIAEALKSPDLADKLKLSDQQVVALSPEKSSARLEADSKKWGEVARKINLRQD